MIRRFTTSLRKFNDFETAAKNLRAQIQQLEKEIMGETNIRSNLSTMTSFPTPTKQKVRVDDLPTLFEETIKTTGPIPLLTYMRQCLTHPQFGYYTTRNPLDLRTGDFVTSPEISSVFGEMIGIYYFQLWKSQGCPSSINFVEFGPGKGTLMNDVVRVFHKLSKMKLNIVMIETSRVLRRIQHDLLSNSEYVEGENGKADVSKTAYGDIYWVENETEIDELNLPSTNFVIAHEFFDALPIKSFQKTEFGWREFMVEHSPSVENHQVKLPSSETDDERYDNEFHLTLSPKETPSSKIPELSTRFKDLPIGSRIEISPDSELFITKIASLIDNQSNTGGALVIDYGVVGSVPDVTLRGIYQHKFVSPFFKPGEVDLSIDVDFDHLCHVASTYTQILGPVTQGDWLHEMGVGHRINQLINSAKPEEQQKIYDAYVRLTDNEQMGSVYKFMGLVPKKCEIPLGFMKLSY